MKDGVHVRFAAVRDSNSFNESGNRRTDSLSSQFERTLSLGGPDSLSRKGSTRTRSSCLPCRQRHAKCNKFFPVCSRCQRTGAVCQPQPRLAQWQIVTPWLLSSSLSTPASLEISPNINKLLLQHWLEFASQIMAIDLNSNPLSFPIIQHLGTSTALIHALQSVSAAHQHFFDASSLTSAIQERYEAVKLIRYELSVRSGSQALMPLFLAVYLIGSFTTWIEGNFSDFGFHHLLGGRALLDTLLANHDTVRGPDFDYILGCYVGWDSFCSIIAEPSTIPDLDTPQIRDIISGMRLTFHPMLGYTIGIIYCLGNIGRYCRKIMAGQKPDYELQRAFEKQLQQWTYPVGSKDSTTICEAFRKHGLIMLYRVCDRVSTSHGQTTDYLGTDPTKEEIIRTYALQIIEELLKTPITSAFCNMHTIPLLTAGSELTTHDAYWRDESISRFKAMYSRSRIPSSLVAIQVTQEVWSKRDQGVGYCQWFDIIFEKGWRVKLS